ncbi:MAG TPA: xanthine dehydrogenase family protein molybdopterin-binding subunit [Hyphomicrobiaceae bacterium]|nr:xanthine dehydrogenase family protein molybdopterin-binding subunit [Hyphomicrobiaceae bacterium]
MQEKVNSTPATGFNVIGSRPIRPDGMDKVTGRARFGADYNLPGQLVGKVLRSPHPHARIRSIDVTAALALDGVKSIVTRDDFPEQADATSNFGEGTINFHDVTRTVMAREKALFAGHPVAAVAATSEAVARRALKLIKVDYEVLPFVIDVDEAMKPDAPILHEKLVTQGVTPPPTKPTNIAKRVEFVLGDVDKGFKDADIVVQRDFKTAAVHQGYIEPHAVLATVAEDGQAEVWVSTQGHWIVRSNCAALLGWDISKIKVNAAEIGGGFGAKTVVYLEPLALALSKKAGRPVKMVMSREEVMRASGPTSAASMTIKVGVKKDGRIVAGEALLKYQAGALPGSPVGPGCMCAFAPYDIENVKTIGYDVVSNRPKVAAYRAPGAPISEYAVECVLDEIAGKLGMDPIEFRLKNAAKEGTRLAYGPKMGPIGYIETLEAAKASAHWRTPLGKNQGRGVASGYWFNIGGETTVSLVLNEDGTLVLTAGTPDIGGLRASLAMMASEELGVPLDKIRVQIGDTNSLGYNFLTGGSRSTYSSGMATVDAARDIKKEVMRRAAKLWDLPEEAVEWDAASNAVRPAGPNAGKHKPITLRDIAKMTGKTGGPIVGYARLNAHGAGPSLATHIADVEIDPETGKVSVIRYTAIQDAGRAIHPSYVEGQYQGGAVQGIGWALNEEYIYGSDGQLQNAGFLDYRIPVASDVPMIDTVIVEVPNPRHPYGVRGVGETPIVPPMAAIANAVADATGVRFTELPMSPPRVLARLEAARKAGEKGLKV